MNDLKRMQKEIDEMEKALEEPDAGAEEFRTDPPGTEAPGTQAPGTEAPGTEAPGTESPGTEAPGTEAPGTEAPGTSAPSTEAPVEDVDFLGDTDLDDLTRDPELFNQLLNKVHKMGIEAGRLYTRSTGERLIRSIPDITKNTIAIQAQLAEVNKKFYEDNKDLLPWKKSVAAVFEELISENPDKHYNELLPEVAEEVRKRIGLQKKADGDRGKDKGNPPKLPKKKSGQRQSITPDLTSIEKEMEEMDKALGLE